MTTVTIGSYRGAPPPDLGQALSVSPDAEPTRSEPLSPRGEEPDAFAPAQNEKEDPSGAEVRVFSAPDPVRRRLPPRAVRIVRFLLAAGAGLFVWLGGTFGSEELRAAIAEAVRRVLNG